MRFDVSELNAAAGEISVGDEILLSGTVFTARDAAHKKIFEILESGGELPFPLSGSAIYYAGPTPARPGQVCGSFGPTTSCRMDSFAPTLYDMGLSATIGKGERSAEVVSAIKRNRAIYLCAIGGAGALAARCISELEVIAFSELGCESVKRLIFKDFPLICAVDSDGKSIFNRKTD